MNTIINFYQVLELKLGRKHAEKNSPGGMNIKQEPAATDKLKKTIIFSL